MIYCVGIEHLLLSSMAFIGIKILGLVLYLIRLSLNCKLNCKCFDNLLFHKEVFCFVCYYMSVILKVSSAEPLLSTKQGQGLGEEF